MTFERTRLIDANGRYASPMRSTLRKGLTPYLCLRLARSTVVTMLMTGMLASAACGGDDPSSQDLISFGNSPLMIDDYAGTWRGKWENTTLDTTGRAEMEITIHREAGTLDLELDLAGDVFGGGDPEPELFLGYYTEFGFSVGTDSKLFGNLMLTFRGDGRVSGLGHPQGVDAFTFEGSNSSTEIALDYAMMVGGIRKSGGTFVLNKK